MKIKAGVLLAYDYELLKTSLPMIYPYLDEIWLAKDVNNLTWAGKPFEIDPSFFTWLKAFDTERKIILYEGDFYKPHLSLMECDTRERKMLAKKMGKCIVLQMDADEYFINFEDLVKDIRSQYSNSPNQVFQICCFWVSIFKQDENGYYLVSPPESFYLASNRPNYTIARKNGKQRKKYLPYFCLHQSWGRTKEDLVKKVENWGHKNDFDTAAYLAFWESINIDNYHTVKDFHPFIKGAWSGLDFYPAKNLEELSAMVKNKNFNLKSYCFKKNVGQEIKYLFRKSK